MNPLNPHKLHKANRLTLALMRDWRIPPPLSKLGRDLHFIRFLVLLAAFLAASGFVRIPSLALLLRSPPALVLQRLASARSMLIGRRILKRDGLGAKASVGAQRAPQQLVHLSRHRLPVPLQHRRPRPHARTNSPGHAAPGEAALGLLAWSSPLEIRQTVCRKMQLPSRGCLRRPAKVLRGVRQA